MSTIASPRPSISLSRTTSASTDTTTRSSSTTRAPAPAPGAQRRNRAALRDYYGLKAAATADGGAKKDETAPEDVLPVEELDRPGFNAEQYVQEVLGREGLEGILRVEAGLISEIRGFGGEQKGLIYDNYSKLIGATDTIRRMRTSMDPLTPTTSTLAPAIAHIAETAVGLSSSLEYVLSEPDHGFTSSREKERRTVQWVLDAPSRLSSLRSKNMEEEARRDWTKIASLLDRWAGVEGVEEVRQSCKSVMQDNT